MLLEICLILPIYLLIFVIFYRFRNIIKMASDINEFLCVENNNDSEEVSDNNKRDFLIQIINQGKADKLPGKTLWTVAKIRKASDLIIEKLHHEYHQNEAKHKAEKTGKAVSAHAINLYSKGVSRFLKINNVDQLRKDIDEDPIIKESMAGVGGLLVGTFGPYLTPILIAAHTANHIEGFAETEKKVEDIESFDHSQVGDNFENK